jgi:hypothetical protein
MFDRHRIVSINDTFYHLKIFFAQKKQKNSSRLLAAGLPAIGQRLKKRPMSAGKASNFG